MAARVEKLNSWKPHNIHSSLIKGECRALVVLLPHPADKRERLALLLITKQRDTLHQVSCQNKILDAEHLVDVELRVNEGHASQIVVLQDP